MIRFNINPGMGMRMQVSLGLPAYFPEDSEWISPGFHPGLPATAKAPGEVSVVPLVLCYRGEWGEQRTIKKILNAWEGITKENSFPTTRLKMLGAGDSRRLGGKGWRTLWFFSISRKKSEC